MILSDLRPHDAAALLEAWPGAVASPRWRLGGESPSPGLLHELTTGVDHQRTLRADDGGAVGLLQVCEVDRAQGHGYLAFLLPAPPQPAPAPVLPFLREALDMLALRRVTVQVDEDVVAPLEGALTHLHLAGRLRAHTRVGPGRYLDRLVFELRHERERA
jgi:hypothetical protein